jgi:hypothetical protein
VGHRAYRSLVNGQQERDESSCDLERPGEREDFARAVNRAQPLDTLTQKGRLTQGGSGFHAIRDHLLVDIQKAK